MPPLPGEYARLRDLTSAQRWLLAAILVGAAALRIGWNNVESYSPADETVYANYTRTLVDGGFFHAYPEIAHTFENDSRRWVYPSPLRWGYFGLSTLAAHIYGSAEPRGLAWLSTIAGILAVPLIFGLAIRLFDARVAFLAAAFTAVSGIELALGRRALQDEVFCLSVLASAYCVLVIVTRRDDETPRWFIALAVASLTLSFAIKESFLYLIPAFAVLLLLHRKPRELRLRHAALFILPPFFYFVGFCLLTRSAGMFFRIGELVTSAMKAPYVVQYQSGPPHRLLLDFFITTPLVSILAAAAIVFIALTASKRGSERSIALFAVVAMAIFALVPSKNLRFHVMLDPFLRLLAAWIIASTAVTARALSAWILAAVAAANAAIEIEIFHTIFIAHDGYDPVTQTLLQALGALPRDNAGADHVMLFPFVCAALIALWWMWPRDRSGRTATITPIRPVRPERVLRARRH
jgi:4-amino-4-deoxy-L-arabinose transferase-like glycosyltransferase